MQRSLSLCLSSQSSFMRLRAQLFPNYCKYRYVKQTLRWLSNQTCAKSYMSTQEMCSLNVSTTLSTRRGYIRKPLWHCGVLEAKYLICNRSLIETNKVFKRLNSQDVQSSKFSMQNPLYAKYLNSLVEEFKCLQSDSGSMFDKSDQTISRFNFLRAAATVIESLQAKYQDLTDLYGLLQDEKDSEMKKLIESEIEIFKQELESTEDEVIHVLVGDDPADNSNITLEVTAGVGGQEAMLFCQEVYDMYCNYAVRKGWRLAEPSGDESEMGGARQASVEIHGHNVYQQFKHEGGVHRVQRVPRTEKSGRIHTSTITVAVIPLPNEIDIDIQQKDLKIETFRNSGPGGQSVNTTDSAVRITHIPSGTVAEAKEERSQIKNRDIALKKIKQRVYEAVLQKQQAEIRASRQQQQGTRARSEKIRTYNFQQDRITDHRTRESIANLAEVLTVGGEGLDSLIEGLALQERQSTLDAMIEAWDNKEK